MDWNITSETQLESALPTIDAFWKNHIVTGSFSGVDNVLLAYAWCVPESPRGTIVISAGRIEAYLKYKETIYDLYRNGFAVFIHDHRGQGLSGRMTDNPHHGYVSTFDDYVTDMLMFVKEIVSEFAPTGPRYLIAHSMGCAIGVLTALLAPGIFQRVVLCSPMFGIRPALPSWMEKALLNASMRMYSRLGKSSGYFFGQADYASVPFSKNKLTQSHIRYQIFRKLYKDIPILQLGGVTFNWLTAALLAMDDIKQRAGDLRLPCLVLSAGADKVVDNCRQYRVVKNMPNATFKTIPGARHELLIERDEIRLPVMTLLLNFLTESPQSTSQ